MENNFHDKISHGIFQLYTKKKKIVLYMCETINFISNSFISYNFFSSRIDATSSPQTKKYDYKNLSKHSFKQ